MYLFFCPHDVLGGHRRGGRGAEGGDFVGVGHRNQLARSALEEQHDSLNTQYDEGESKIFRQSSNPVCGSVKRKTSFQWVKQHRA